MKSWQVIRSVKDEIKKALQTPVQMLHNTQTELLHSQDTQPTINVMNKIPVMAYTQNKTLNIIINQWLQFQELQLIPHTTLWVS
jgi:cellobiose phosphorylase